MGPVNPFQQINASLPPLMPVPPPRMNELGDPLPDSGKPAVFADAPAQPSSQDRQQTVLGGRLEQDYQKDAHPWGTPDNHPGVFGKIGHALSLVTGGPYHRQLEEQGIEGRLNKLAELQSQMGVQSAQAGNLNATAEHTEAETPEIAPDAASKRGLETAETGHADAETDALRNPADTNPDIATYRSLTKMGMSASDALQEIERDKALALKPSGMEKVNIVGPDGKPVVANYHPDSGKITDASGKEIPNAKPYEKSPEGPHQFGFEPDAQGGYSAIEIKPGMHVAPGFQTASGVNSMNTPTSQQRNAGGRADLVLSAIPDVLGDLRQNASQLGPGMGRFNDIYSGKVGAPNPEFSGLMADLHLLGTAVALAHAQGRMSNELLTEFNSMIASPQQSPESIEAVLGKVQNFMQRASQQGKRRPATGEATPGDAGPKVMKFNQSTGRLE